MSNQDQLKELIVRYHQGQCSSEELELLRTLLRDPDKQHLLEEVYDLMPESDDERLYQQKDDLYRQIIHDPRAIRHTESRKHGKSITFLKQPWLVAAAVILLLALPLAYYSLMRGGVQEQISDETTEYAIVPGGNRAHILLDDGQVIDLEQIQGDTVIQQNGFSIVRKDGSISYRYDQQQLSTVHTIYNTIVTPKGGQYNVELPDGTQVWLNAESSLKYPVYFAEDMREVELKGEGYFDVAKHKRAGHSIPFIVQSGEQRLEVLGTVFNIDSYGESIKTTLVEGKVRLGLKDHTGQNVILHPNEQATFHVARQQFNVKSVDPIYATAWKSGNFSFQRATIREVMESISRWYDVDIVYNGDFSNDFFTGTISRFAQIDKLLQTIELTGSVHFKIEGRRIMVGK